MKNSRNVIIVILISALILSVILVSYISTFVQPDISAAVKIGAASHGGYGIVMNEAEGYSDGSWLKKCRDISIRIQINYPKEFINNVVIEKNPPHPHLILECLKNNNKIQLLGGGMNPLKDGEEYYETMEVYLKNISEAELRDIVGNIGIRILWQNIWGREKDRIIYLKDYMK